MFATHILRKVLLLPVLVALPTALAGQPSPEPEPVARMHAGVGLAVAQPTGEFRDYVSVGGGLYGFFRASLDEGGLLGVRVHGAVLTYGNETKRVCFSETVGCRVELDLTTSNNIFLLGIGPEVGVPLGPTRLYASTTVGFGHFSTDSQVGGTVQGTPFASTRNYGDGGLAWNAGGGIELGLGRIQGAPALLDLGLSYQRNGRREYLTEGGIVDQPDGSIRLDVKRSNANFLVWRIGLSVGLVPEGRSR